MRQMYTSVACRIAANRSGREFGKSPGLICLDHPVHLKHDCYFNVHEIIFKIIVKCNIFLKLRLLQLLYILFDEGQDVKKLYI